MPQLLGRREIGLPTAGALTNELNAKHVYMGRGGEEAGGVCSRLCMCYVILVTNGQ